jgi:1,4-dihydroxy-2-naphthoate polyprenyltransferase
MRSSRSGSPTSASSPATPEAAWGPRATGDGAPGLVRWIMATRPATLTAAAAPCWWAPRAPRRGRVPGGPRPGRAGRGALLLQIGANLANDLFDFEKGADTPDRLGPTRVVQSGLLSPGAVRAAWPSPSAWPCWWGSTWSWVAGPVIVVIGLLSIAAAIAYTGGPYPLGYNGLGDIAVFASSASSRCAAPPSSRRGTSPRWPGSPPCPWAP